MWGELTSVAKTSDTNGAVRAMAAGTTAGGRHTVYPHDAARHCSDQPQSPCAEDPTRRTRPGVLTTSAILAGIRRGRPTEPAPARTISPLAPLVIGFLRAARQRPGWAVSV